MKNGLPCVSIMCLLSPDRLRPSGNLSQDWVLEPCNSWSYQALRICGGFNVEFSVEIKISVHSCACVMVVCLVLLRNPCSWDWKDPRASHAVQYRYMVMMDLSTAEMGKWCHFLRREVAGIGSLACWCYTCDGWHNKYRETVFPCILSINMETEVLFYNCNLCSCSLFQSFIKQKLRKLLYRWNSDWV